MLGAASITWAASSGVVLRTVFFSPAARAGLHLPEGAEQHVGKAAVHRLAHDDREDQTRCAVESAGDDQQFVVQHETHQAGRQTGIAVEQGDDGGHIRPADREDQQHAEDQRQNQQHREKAPQRGIDGQNHRRSKTAAPSTVKLKKILPFENDGALRQDFLQLAGGHERSGEGEVPSSTSTQRMAMVVWSSRCPPD